MLKNTLKRLLPHSKKIKNDRQLRRVLGEWLNRPHLWVLNRHGISRAIFIGLFCSFIPLPGQMLLAALFAVYFRANLPLAISLVWISNPITILPIMYAAYWLGCYLLNTPVIPLDLSSDISWIWRDIDLYWQPLLLGCFISGLLTASLGYWIIQLLWRWSVNRNWKIRRNTREIKKENSL